MWTAIASLAALALAIWTWWAKNNTESKAKKEQRKKDIHDAVYSKDVSRINAIVMRLRK